MNLLSACTSSLDSGQTEELLQLVLEAHETAAEQNENGSSIAVVLSSAGSGDFSKAVMAALSTIGAAHGPITQARGVIYGHTAGDVARRVDDGWIVPGWGSSFFKDGIDPAWQEVRDHLAEEYEDHWSRIVAITGALVSRGKRLYPNAAAFSGAAAEILGIPVGAEACLFIAGRLPAWVRLYEGR